MVYFGIIFAGVFGAIIGSFSVAQVWRLRAAELYDIKKSGGEVDKKEWSKLKYLISEKHKKNRSHCLSCGYKLQWFDLIPVFSWLSLGGKCRKCHTKIGLLEFLAEVATAIIFGIIFASMQVDLIKISAIDLFRITLLFLALSPLVILFVYDAKWSLLPVKVMWIFNFLAGIYWLSSNFEGGFSATIILNLVVSLALFPGIYFILSAVSKGAWVGEGDWILAIGLVFLLPNKPIYTIFLLLFSNLIGLAIIFSQAIVRKKMIKKHAQIPFGPAMILACVLLLTFQPFFVNFLKNLMII